MELVWLEEAVNDLKEMGQFIAMDNPVAAYEVLVRIKAAVDSLEQIPHLGRPGRVSNTRELVVAGLPYIVPYTIKKNQIRILAVMHSSRKWPDSFSRS